MCRHKLPDNQALQNAPKLEATMLLMASRIAKKLQIELANLINEVLVVTDSQLLINMVRGTSAALVRYLASRMRPALENTQFTVVIWGQFGKGLDLGGSSS